MTENRVFNFAAGPGVLPEQALKTAQAELMNYHGCGMSVMEMSHRSKMFLEIFAHAEAQFKKLMQVPEDYEILFLQGGGSAQFSMIPLNLISRTGKADYAVTGNFSNIAYKEGKKYGDVRLAYDDSGNGFSRIPTQAELNLDPQASYFYYCSNNTIYGTEWKDTPDTHGVPIACDMSSDIMSRKVDVSKYGLIFAGAQKNMAPAGVTAVIIRRDLAGHELPITPLMMNYQTMIEKDSMYNTPPCWCIYMLGLTMDWLEEQGGVEAMEQIRYQKSQLIYDVLDHSHLYQPHAEKDVRSQMNVTFTTGSDELDQQFVSEAAEQGMVNLKGHRLTKGIRASLYNAMPMAGAEKLREFMIAFERKNEEKTCTR